MDSESWRQRALLAEYGMRLAIERYLELERLARAAALRMMDVGTSCEEFDALTDYFSPLTGETAGEQDVESGGLDAVETRHFNG